MTLKDALLQVLNSFSSHDDYLPIFLGWAQREDKDPEVAAAFSKTELREPLRKIAEVAWDVPDEAERAVRLIVKGYDPQPLVQLILDMHNQRNRLYQMEIDQQTKIGTKPR